MTLREAREKSGITQAELARRLGLKRAAVSRYESGDRCPPGWRAREIEKALRVKAGSIEWPRPAAVS